MCGIAGVHRIGNQPIPRAGRLADELLLAIESRGTHSTGWLAMLDNGKVQLDKSLDTASVYINGRTGFDETFRTLLLHTRYATTGGKTLRNAHPVINGKCAAVHNGTIWNHEDVFRQLGLKRHADVDSEVIPAVVSWAGWGEAASALSLLDGGMATAIVTNEHVGDVVLARLSGYPLHYMIRDDMIVWASTEEAIRRAWQRTFPRRRLGRFIELPPFRLHKIDARGRIERVDIEDRYEVSRWDREVTRWQRQRRASRTWVPESKPTGGKKGGRRSGAAIPSGPVTGTTAKKRRKRSRARNGSTGQLPLNHVETPTTPSEDRRTAPVDAHDGFRWNVEDWETQIIELMRYTNISREEAEDEVLGYSPTRAGEDTLAWLHRDEDDDIEWSL